MLSCHATSSKLIILSCFISSLDLLDDLASSLDACFEILLDCLEDSSPSRLAKSRKSSGRGSLSPRANDRKVRPSRLIVLIAVTLFLEGDTIDGLRCIVYEMIGVCIVTIVGRRGLFVTSRRYWALIYTIVAICTDVDSLAMKVGGISTTDSTD